MTADNRTYAGKATSCENGAEAGAHLETVRSVLKKGDARELISDAPIIKTWFLDPPYNIGYDYRGGYSDNLAESEYRDLIREVSSACYERTAEGGSFFFLHYPEDAARLLPVIESAGFSLHQWLTWAYNGHITSTKRFRKSQRALLWFSKGEVDFSPLATVAQYRNPEDRRVKATIRSGREGAVHYDWWFFHQVKGGSKGHRYTTQVPEELIRRCILHTTTQGEWVGDAFLGSGSTVRAALAAGRNGWGCDLNSEAWSCWGDIPESLTRFNFAPHVDRGYFS